MPWSRLWRGGRLRAAVAGFRPFPHAILTIEYNNEDVALLLKESRRTLQCAVRLLGQLHRVILRTGEARQAMRGMHCHRQWTGCAADTAVCSGTHLQPRVALRADLRRARVGQHEPSGAQACHATSSVHREMQRNLRACEVSRCSCISAGLGIVMSKRAGPAHGVQPPSATHRPATPSRDKPRRDTTRRAWFDRTARGLDRGAALVCVRSVRQP